MAPEVEPNSRPDFEAKFQPLLGAGWFRKPKYRLLSRLFPRWALRTKIRKTYHAPVARLAEGRFLDLGCGLGSCAALYTYHTRRLAVGVDFAIPAVAYAAAECRRFGIGARFLAGDGYGLPFADGVFDSAYIGQVIEHLPDEREVLREALRVLKPGGLLIVSVPIGTACSGGDADHVNFYHSEEEFKAVFADLPVEQITFHPFHAFRYFLSCRSTGAPTTGRSSSEVSQPAGR